MLSTQPLSFHILSKLSPLTHINTNQQVPAFILRSFLQQPAAASNTIPSILPFSFVQKSFFNQLKTFTHIWNKWSRCCCVCVVCPGLICSVSCCVFVRVWPIWCSRCRPHVRSQLYNEPIAVLLLWNTLHTLFSSSLIGSNGWCVCTSPGAYSFPAHTFSFRININTLRFALHLFLSCLCHPCCCSVVRAIKLERHVGCR